MTDGVGFDRENAAALLGWWREAGVDVAVRENAPSWRSLTPAARIQENPAERSNEAPTSPLPSTPPTAPTQAPTPTPTPAPAPKPLPETLEGIEGWLARRSDELDATHLRADVPMKAPLLAIGARGDDRAGLTAPARELFERMMAAIGMEVPPLLFIDPAYRPGQPARAPFDPMLIEAVKRRLSLATPARLLLFGEQAARALLETPLPKARGRLHMVEGARCVATFHPRWLLDRRGDKRLAWQDLQILMGDE